jgi:hypothetical protein
MKLIIMLTVVSLGLAACAHKGSGDEKATGVAPIASTVTPQQAAPPTSMECLQNSIFNVNTGHYTSMLNGMVNDCLTDHELFLADGYFGNIHIDNCETWTAILGETYLPASIGDSNLCFAKTGLERILSVPAINTAAWTAPKVSECTPDVDCSAQCVNTLALGLTDGKALQICF